MQLEIYQWLVPLIGITFLVRIILQYIRNKRTVRSLIFWIVIWLTIIILAIIPNSLSQRIAVLLGFKDNVNAIIFVALGLLFIFVFYLSNAIERMDRKMAHLVRTIAIREEERHLGEEKEQAKDKKQVSE